MYDHTSMFLMSALKERERTRAREREGEDEREREREDKSERIIMFSLLVSKPGYFSSSVQWEH